MSTREERADVISACLREFLQFYGSSAVFTLSRFFSAVSTLVLLILAWKITTERTNEMDI